MNFGERLKELREDKNLIQQDIADILKVGRATIAGYETKGKQPDYDKLTKLAEFFNVSTDYLLGRTDTKSPADEISSAIKDDEELLMFWNELKDRDDLQLLFKQSKNLDSKTIQQIIRIIKAIEDEESKED